MKIKAPVKKQTIKCTVCGSEITGVCLDTGVCLKPKTPLVDELIGNSSTWNSKNK